MSGGLFRIRNRDVTLWATALLMLYNSVAFGRAPHARIPRGVDRAIRFYLASRPTACISIPEDAGIMGPGTAGFRVRDHNSIGQAAIAPFISAGLLKPHSASSNGFLHYKITAQGHRHLGRHQGDFAFCYGKKVLRRIVEMSPDLGGGSCGPDRHVTIVYDVVNVPNWTRMPAIVAKVQSAQPGWEMLDAPPSVRRGEVSGAEAIKVRLMLTGGEHGWFVGAYDAVHSQCLPSSHTDFPDFHAPQIGPE